MSQLRRIPLLLARALTRACPSCGGHGVYQNYWRYKERCPTCQLHLERGEPGYVVGTYMFNLVASELIFAATMVTWVLRVWPDVPWVRVQYTGVTLMILLPILFYPFAKALFLAFHLFWLPQGDTDR
ncbi:MAG TPA: DUF983 domain-containing protein [Gemmatimonadales bacterium]|nr:DUF983 domain-containing protein [Gemmatimonadales bacterium]